MSGDVQPRKRKDKKKKKDELGVEEPRGTAAVFGEGDVFMHSYHDHGTGGHWCAKIIFFSLLAILVTLIGLIILENRGLSELEANAVESRYSGVLEGWLEDAPDDDHHDEHTLELKHHDDEDDHDDEDEHDDEHDGDDEHDDDDDDEHDDEDDEHDDEDKHDDVEEKQYDSQQDLEEADDEDEDVRFSYSKYFGGDDDDEDDGKAANDDVDNEPEANDENDSTENKDDNESADNEADDEEQEETAELDGDDADDDIREQENLSTEIDDNEENADDDEIDETQENEDDEEHDEDDKDEEIEVEKIEQEPVDEDPISTELPALPEEDDEDDRDEENEDEDTHDETDEIDDGDDDFLEADEPSPVVERITAPAGKPFVEVEEEEVSSEKPPDTLKEEEEYEKQQEQLKKKEEESSHHMWLKLTIGGALLVATHAVVRRATAPRDVSHEESTREETPVVDRRMTLIPEEPEPVIFKKAPQQTSKPSDQEVQKEQPISKSPPPPVNQPSEEYEEDNENYELEEVDEEIEELEEQKQEAERKELYSDDEEVENEEEIVEEKKEASKSSASSESKKEIAAKPDEEDVPDDVEIIEEELEEEEEEDISDVDDAELLTRLEAKYGRLPEPERPGYKHKDGGNGIEDEWPGEPADHYWRQHLNSAERDLRQGSWSEALERASAEQLSGSTRARWLVAVALDRMAEAQRDNRLLSRAIAAYLNLLKMNEKLSDQKLREIADRTLDRIQFRGNYLNAEPVYRVLIRRFPDNPGYRNNLTISFLMANRADLAEEVLKETLHLWPNDRVALAHYGFVLKNQHNKNEEAVKLFEKALEGDKGPACEPRFYYHYGDALLLLGRYKEAHEVHKRAAKHGHFLSPAQRSLYNVKHLKSKPWWNVEDTPYVKLALALEKYWSEILKEGEAARALFEQEKEGLKEKGDWSQMDLFVRGREIPERCKRAPVTCSIVKSEAAAVGCRRGQIKFSAMEPGTHVRPHVGPTNCRLRMHLGLSNTKDTYIRVDQETRQWKEGKVLLFDDSFEHEVWHNGTAKRLVLIVDLWHPDLTAAERRSLPAI